MSEPTKQIPGRIVISPDDPARSRSWPDPAVIDDDLIWKATYTTMTLTPAEMHRLVDAASTYAYIFSISQRQFMPTHAAIRAHLARNAVGGLENGLDDDVIELRAELEHARPVVQAARELLAYIAKHPIEAEQYFTFESKLEVLLSILAARVAARVAALPDTTETED